MATASSCRKITLFGLARLVSGAAIVTTLSPRLLRECQRIGGAKTRGTPPPPPGGRGEGGRPGKKTYKHPSVFREISLCEPGPPFPTTDNPHGAPPSCV